MTRNVQIPYDLEKYPLEIRTDSRAGDSNANVDILFHDANGNYIGQLYFGFSLYDNSIYGSCLQVFIKYAFKLLDFQTF